MTDKHDERARELWKTMLQPALAGGYKHRDDMIRDIAAALRQAAADEREALREAVSDEAQALGMVRARTTEMIFENACEAVDAARGTEQGK